MLLGFHNRNGLDDASIKSNTYIGQVARGILGRKHNEFGFVVILKHIWRHPTADIGQARF